MTRDEARISELYAAFAGKNFDGFLDMLAPDVNWPNDTDDTRLIGRDAVRAFLPSDDALRVTCAPLWTSTADDGRVSVVSRRRIDGANTHIRHIYELRNDLVVRMDIERNIAALMDEDKLETLLTRLFDAVDRRDIETVMSTFHPHATIPDSLEQVTVSGHDAIRAYYLRQVATIQVGASLLSAKRLSDDSVEAALHVLVRGKAGGFWWEGPVTATYRLQDGLLADMAFTEGWRA